jgi:predicted acylesterase/phospholipase RssA
MPDPNVTSPTPDAPRIALTFSGGGFRASAFCLGALTYLDKIKINDKSLLEHCIALSTVSGGTITGARYAFGISQKNPKETIDDIYQALYKFMSETDLPALSLDKLTKDWKGGRLKTLINSFADIYDEKLFNHGTFSSIMRDDLHLKHISFNATEFSSGIQFRFQWSEEITKAKDDEPKRGLIGNNNFRIPEDVAREIRMADILAASSCFPAGFEPINFPTDFSHKNSPNLNALTGPNYPVGLMDGGIVDNQGIAPIELAEKRMKRNLPDASSKDDNEFDLIIVCDVASPFLDAYQASIENKKNGWRDLTPSFILVANTILLLASIFSVIYAVKYYVVWLMIVGTSVGTISLVIYLLGAMLRSLPKKFDVPESFLMPLGKLLKLKLRVYENMISNRVSSILKMTVGVFLKHVRGLNYNKIYQSKKWKNRGIMNAVYELRCGNTTLTNKIKKGTLPGNLMPSQEIQRVATAAASMGTTLWFTPEELKKKDMLNQLIATGHFTTCWNLLVYIDKIKKDNENTNSRHQAIIALEQELLTDWDKFNKDPLSFVKELNKRKQ